MRIATTSLRTGLAMTPLTRSAGDGGTHGSRPTAVHFCGAGPVCPAESAVRNRRADRGVRPYGNVTRGAAKRAVGEIGEALPVADEASRFRGSAPIGGHDSDRKSVGTTVGNRRPLRMRYKECGARPGGRGRTPPLRKRYKKVRCGEESPSHGFAVPAFFRQGSRGDGGCGLPRPVCELVSQ